MTTLLAYVWQRRWCFFSGTILTLVGLPLLHPFVRQALFGPTIDDIPWCVWEDAVRYRAHPERAEGSWLQRTLIKAGWIKAQRPPDAQLSTPAAIPVLLHLAEDRDPLVRRVALRHLQWQRVPDIEKVLPVFRAHLQDSDPHCRLIAAAGTFQITSDPEMAKVALAFLSDPDSDIRRDVAYILEAVAPQDVDLFGPLATLADDPDYAVRCHAVFAQRHFGKRGVPILRKAMRDPRPATRVWAIQTAAQLGKDAAELIPDLLALQNDPNASVPQVNINAVLTLIDPEAFPVAPKADP